MNDLAPHSSEEVAELRIRLQEAEETLRAILSSEVDGLVIAGPQGDQVFALRGAEHPYRVFIERMSEGALTLTQDGLILFANRRFAEFLNVPVETIAGQNVTSLPDPALRAGLADLIRNPHASHPKEISRYTDGELRVLTLTAQWLDQDASLAVIVTDVTAARTREAILRRSHEEMEAQVRERTDVLVVALNEVREARAAAVQMMEDAVNAARALELANRDLERQIVARRQSEEAQRLLSTVVEQAAESILITDTTGVLQYVNPAFERISGYSRKEALGQTPRILKSGKHDDQLYETLWTTISTGSVWRGHFVNRRKDGSLYEEEATISPVRDNDGTITNFVAIKRDVTSEVALEEQLRHAQKIEAIGTLAGGVAHDFNNLLQVMVSQVQLLRRKCADQPDSLDHLRQLEQTIRRGAQLTRQLLLFARRETSKRENVDLNQILAELQPFLRRVMRANIGLTIEPAEWPLWMNADRGQLEQIIMNLTVNAIDAMPDGGTLSIVASRDGTNALLRVRDTGSGIPDAIRDRIFEPFFTTKEVGKGTGLGLSVVHGIVAAHAGSIDVSCLDAPGTTFQLLLPLQPVAPISPNAHAGMIEDVPEGRGERILVVEDEEAAREGLSEVLELLGYSVIAVGSGEEAMALPRTPPFSVLLTDFMLPGIPGIEVVLRIRATNPEIKAIVMSGYAAPGVIDAGVAANEFQFLQKPFDMGGLARALRDTLRLHPDP